MHITQGAHPGVLWWPREMGQEGSCCLFFQLLSHVQLFVTPWTVARQAPMSVGFSRQEYWSGLPFPSPREGGGRLKREDIYIYIYIKSWLIHIVTWQKSTQHWKVIILQLKKKKSNWLWGMDTVLSLDGLRGWWWWLRWDTLEKRISAFCMEG